MEINDELEPVLVFVGTADDVKVTIGGTDAKDQAKVTIEGNKLTVLIEEEPLAANVDAEVKVTFDAKIKSGADLSKYTSGVLNVAEIVIDDNPEVTTDSAKLILPPASTPTPAPSGSKTPKTGDASTPALWIVLMIMATAVAVGLKRRYNK